MYWGSLFSDPSLITVAFLVTCQIRLLNDTSK
jgi:hypothetical protein